jgi:hypothetical protein
VRRNLALILSVFLLLAMGRQVLAQVPNEAEAFGNKYLDLLLMKEEIKSYDLLTDEAKKQFALDKHKEIIDKINLEFGQYKSIKMVGGNVLNYDGQLSYSLSYELEYASKWALFSIDFKGGNNKFEVRRYNVAPLSDSLEHSTRFTFEGKGIVHYLFLVFMLIEFLFIIYVAVNCLRTQMKKKVLWVLFILCGICSISFNWESGYVSVQPLSIQFMFGISAFKMGLYAPWIMTFSIPLGAILFLIKRKKLDLSVSS